MTHILRAARLLPLLVLVPLSLTAQPSLLSGRAVVIPKESQFAHGIETRVARPQTVMREIALPARIEPSPASRIDIVAPVSGRVMMPPRGLPEEGRLVSRSETILLIEPRLSEMERELIVMFRESLESDVRALEQRRATADREYRKLAKLRQLVARNRVREAAAEVASVEAALESKRAMLERLNEIETKPRPVVAPMRGVVSDLGVAPGDVVRSGARLFTVVDEQALDAVARVPASMLSAVRAAGTAAVETEGGGRVAATPVAITPRRDRSDDHVSIRYRLARSERLREGMSATLRVPAGSAYQRLLIPASAIARVEGRDVVFVHARPERFSIRPVRTGKELRGGLVPVEAGVRPGERVVVTGVNQIVSMMRGVGVGRQ